MIECLNKDGFFKRNNYSNQQRKRIFYFICIPSRILLALLIFYLLQLEQKELELSILSLIIIFSTYTIINGLTCFKNKVWWNRSFEMIVALTLIILSSIILSNNDHLQFEKKYIAIPLFIDIIFGFILSLFHFYRT